MVFWKGYRKWTRDKQLFLNPTILQEDFTHPATTEKENTWNRNFAGLSQGPQTCLPGRKWVWWITQQIWSYWLWDLQDLTRWGGRKHGGPWPWLTNQGWPIPYRKYRVITTILYLLYIVILLMKLIPILLEPNMPVCYAKKLHTFPTHPCLLSRGGLYCRSIQLPSQDPLDMPAPLFPNTMRSNAVKQKGCRISLHIFPTTKYLKTLPTLISCIGSVNIFVGASNIPRSKIWRPGHWSTEPVVPWSELQLQGTPLLKMANFSKRSLVCY